MFPAGDLLVLSLMLGDAMDNDIVFKVGNELIVFPASDRWISARGRLSDRGAERLSDLFHGHAQRWLVNLLGLPLLTDWNTNRLCVSIERYAHKARGEDQ